MLDWSRVIETVFARSKNFDQGVNMFLIRSIMYVDQCLRKPAST